MQKIVHIEGKVVDTTKLFDQNLTDFLKAVWLDWQYGTYKHLLLKNSYKIDDYDIEDYLERVTRGGADIKRIRHRKNYIQAWEREHFGEGAEELPSITIRMKELLDEMALRINNNTSTQPPPRERQQATTQEIPIDPVIFDKLEQAGMITQDPMQWIGDDGSLCAYFLENYLPRHFARKWAKGRQFFNVRNLAQAKYNYENTKLGKPENHKIIDEILGITE